MRKGIDKIIAENFNAAKLFCHGIKAFNQLADFSSGAGGIDLGAEIAFGYSSRCKDQLLQRAEDHPAEDCRQEKANENTENERQKRHGHRCMLQIGHDVQYVEGIHQKEC